MENVKVSNKEFNEAIEVCNEMLEFDNVVFTGESFRIVNYNRNLESWVDFGYITTTDIKTKYERSESDMLIFQNLQDLLKEM